MRAGPMPLGFRGHCPDCGHDWNGQKWNVNCGLTNYPRIDLRLIWALFQAAQGLPSASRPRGRARSFVATAGGVGRFCLGGCKARTFFHHPGTYRSYFCSRCVVELRVPRRLNRRFWLPWIAENAVYISRLPLVFAACEKVSRILAGTRSRHEPVPIDIGTLVCPGCGDRMAIGDIRTNPLVCPRCKNRAARPVPGDLPWIILMDYGSPDDEEVRRLILHLKELAEHSKGHIIPRGANPPTFEGTAPLWDRELDG